MFDIAHPLYTPPPPRRWLFQLKMTLTEHQQKSNLSWQLRELLDEMQG